MRFSNNKFESYSRGFVFQRKNGEFFTNACIIELLNRDFGFKVVTIFHVKNLIFRFILSFFLLLRCLPLLFANRILITQFPPKFEEIPTILLAHAMRRRNIVIVHDLDHLRGIENRGLKFFRDPFGFKMLRESQVIIQDGPMQIILEQEGISQTAKFEIWPYFIQDKSSRIRPEIFAAKLKPSVVFAGHFERRKSQFLAEMYTLNFPIHIYGRTNGEFSDLFNVVIHGEFKDGAPPNFPWPALGLIWDGDSVNGLTGIYGNYHKLNLPAKFSLYMSLGIPVIVSKDSALGNLVSKNRLGFVVSNLHEIPKYVESKEWMSICKNVDKMGERARRGTDIFEAMLSLLIRR